MTSKLEAAQALAAKGFKVFPIKKGAKFPPLWKDWPTRATSDVSDFPPDANIGIHCEGLLVVDIDPKKGGDNSYAKLDIIYGFPHTLVTLTPTGGQHLFYRMPEGQQAPNTVEKLGKGLDSRGYHGYVIAPGSTVKAGDYRFSADAEIAPAPEWLILKLGTIMPKTGTIAEPVADAPDAIVERAREWLASAEPSVEGQGGDARAYAVAARLRDFGVSEQQAADLMLNHWNDRCEPPWTPGEIAIKCRNAYSYAQNEPGVAAAMPEDFPVHVDETVTSGERVEKVNKTRHVARRLSEFANSETRGPGYLVKGLLQRRSYAEMFGAPGAGKTFTALDVAYCVAAGLPWMGRKVHAGLVLYLAYEGVGGMVKRAQALRQKYGQADVPLYVVGASYNLREPAGRRDLAATLAELPQKPVLIVLDTLARALMGGDENSAQDVGAFNTAVGALIDATGACVMILHHSGKNKNAGARGSSALLGAIDTELEVDSNQIVARKQRDVEIGEPVGFKLVPVVVGIDEDGDELASCVVEPDTVQRPKGGKLTGHASRGFDVLCRLRPNNDPVTDAEWREACAEFLPARKAAFYDIKNALLRRGFIEVNDAGLVTRKCE